MFARSSTMTSQITTIYAVCSNKDSLKRDSNSIIFMIGFLSHLSSKIRIYPTGSHWIGLPKNRILRWVCAIVSMISLLILWLIRLRFRIRRKCPAGRNKLRVELEEQCLTPNPKKHNNPPMELPAVSLKAKVLNKIVVFFDDGFVWWFWMNWNLFIKYT